MMTVILYMGYVVGKHATLFTAQRDLKPTVQNITLSGSNEEEGNRHMAPIREQEITRYHGESFTPTACLFLHRRIRQR